MEKKIKPKEIPDHYKFLGNSQPAHLPHPLPPAPPKPTLTLGAKCWPRGGVGGQLPRNVWWLEIPSCLMSCLLVVFTKHVQILVTVTKWRNKKRLKRHWTIPTLDTKANQQWFSQNQETPQLVDRILIPLLSNQKTFTQEPRYLARSSL